MLDSEIEFGAWRAFADSLPALIFTLSSDGCIEFLNRRARDFIGAGVTSTFVLTWNAIVHPSDVETARDAWKNKGDSGTLAVQLRMRRADGTFGWIEASAAPARDPAGTVLRWCGTIADIEARKHTEVMLRERESMLADVERRFDVLGEAIPVICWTADADGGVDWYNGRWFEFTGLTPEEAAGWGWQAAHHPDDFLEVMRKWPQSIATGDPFEMEFRLRRADGVFHWFLTRAEPLRDPTRNIVRWYGSSVDIEAQKRALERTRRVAETLQDVFLPKTLPQKDGLRFDAIYLPAEKDSLVGGDWFDAFELPDGRIAFSIGDVAGHGLEASIIVGRLRQAIFTLAFRIDDPATLLEEVDRILHYQEPDVIVTALVGFVDRELSTLCYASAGHPPPMIAYTNDVPAANLPYGGPPLGIGNQRPLRTHSVALAPDAVVAVYTDGMTEYLRDPIRGEAKLRAAVALMVGDTSVARPALAVRDIVLDDLPTKDDAALLLMQFSQIDAAMLHFDPSALERTWRFHSSDAYTAHASRREIVKYLRRLAIDPEQMFAAELVVGEILANTVEHAPGLVELHIDWLGEQPIVTIRDTGPGLVALDARLPENPFDEDGRGLFLIGALAEEAALRSSPGYGTEMRIVLPVRRLVKNDRTGD